MRVSRTVAAVFCLLLASAPGASASRPAFHPTKPKTVWDYWYVVSVKSLPYEMENDKVVLHGDKVQFVEHVWKKEEGFINEEELGAFALADQAITPLFFNYRSAYRSSETIVDGNVHDGKNLVVSVRKNGQTQPVISHSISSGTFFEVFFPLWVGKELKQLKPGQAASFSTIFEDDVDGGFDSKAGEIRIEKPDDFAIRTKTTKVSVDIADLRTDWWVDSQGAAVRTSIPTAGAVSLRVSKEKAQAFLK